MKARKSWAMAYCGMAAALSVALMLLGAVVPVLMFIAPAVASLLIATVCCGVRQDHGPDGLRRGEPAPACSLLPG